MALMSASVVQIFLSSAVLAWMVPATFAAGDTDLTSSIQRDLNQLNITCQYDSCYKDRRSDSLLDYACQCGAQCVQLKTCCIDSQFVQVVAPKFRPTCRSLDDKTSYFMMDHCPPNSAWENLCTGEWSGDDDVVLMKTVPVTSLLSLITYKNYFCFLCHEKTEDYLYWNIQLESTDEFDKNKSASLKYDKYNQVWFAPPLNPEGDPVPVTLAIEIPGQIRSLPTTCEPNLISHCSEMWTDENIREKCDAYMGAVNIERDGYVFKYKNVHCAVCNFEDLRNMICKSIAVGGFAVKAPFSFTHLMDINPSGGDKVGKIQKCKSGEVEDPFAGICRELTCALPGYVIKDGKCVAS